LVGAIASLLVARAARAEPIRHVELAWTQADPRCLGQEELAVAVEHTLGRPVFHGDPRDPRDARDSANAPRFPRVEGAITRPKLGTREHFEAHVRLTDAAGKLIAERTLDTDGDCKRLDESVAVVITLMIDGLEEAPTPLRIQPDPPRPLPPPLLQRTTLPLPITKPSPAFSAFVGAGLSSSLLPGVVGAAVLRGELDAPSLLPVAITARMMSSSDATIGGAGGAFSGWDVELATCPRWQREGAYVGACAGIGGGALTGRPVGLGSGSGHTRPLVVAPVLVQGAIRLFGPLWLRAEAGILVPILRERWGFRDFGGAYVPVFQPDPVAPTGALGLELRTGS
jgi:hypothetical protein